MVRLARVSRRTLLDREKVVESLEQEIARDLVDFDHGHDGNDRRDGNARDPFAATDPAHALVRLALHAHGVALDAERRRERVAHRLAIGRDPRRLARSR